MNCQCRDLFSGELSGSNLQSAVSKLFPNGECELCSMSSDSPGPVKLDETVTKLIVDPIHIDEGKLSPVAFMDAYTIDLSVFREQIATDAEMQIAINQIKETGRSKPVPQERSIVAVAQAKAEVLRSVRFDGTDERMFFIYDTGVSGKPAHASIFTPERVKASKPDQRAVRRALHEIFSGKIIEASQYRALTY